MMTEPGVNAVAISETLSDPVSFFMARRGAVLLMRRDFYRWMQTHATGWSYEVVQLPGSVRPVFFGADLIFSKDVDHFAYELKWGSLT